MKKAIAHLLVVLTCLSSLSVGGYAAEPETLEADLTAEEILLDEDQTLAEDADAVQLVQDEQQEPAASTDEASAADDQETEASVSDADASIQETENIGDTDAEVSDGEQASQDEEVAEEAENAQDEDAVAEEQIEITGEASAETDALLAAATAKIDFSGMSNGWHFVNGAYYYVKSGKAVTGWLKVSGSWYYLDPTKNGAMATGLTTVENDGTYYLNTSTGAMKTGWVSDNSNWYYFASSGRMKTGWLKSNSKWYYLDPTNDGIMVTGLVTIEGDGTYYLNKSSGAMKTGWVSDNSNWYYFTSSGRQKTGWLKSSGKWYYLDPTNDGIMATGLTTIENDGTYYLNASGAMKTGWVSSGGKWYYFASSGRQKTGWMKTGSVWTTKWYYLDPENDGAMTTGWLQTGDTSYYLDKSSGVMKTGWMQSGSDWYFFGVTGKMMTGWIYSGGYDYYLYSKADDVDESAVGTMATSTVIDEREIDASGHAAVPAHEAGASAKDIMVARAQYYSSDTKNLMLMDRSSSKLYIFEGSTNNWNLIRTWSIAAGYYTTPSPSGTYEVQDRGYYFDSGSARCFWWTQFYGSYCFHSILYYQNGTSPSTASVMNASLGSNISHGCVRLATSNAYWVYSNIATGTGVIVY